MFNLEKVRLWDSVQPPRGNIASYFDVLAFGLLSTFISFFLIIQIILDVLFVFSFLT